MLPWLWLLLAALAAPAQALVIPRFGGFKGAPHGAPHETPPPGLHELPQAGRAGAGGPAGARSRVTEPEWLRPAREQVEQALADDAWQRQAEAAGQRAAGGGEHTIEPWPRWPHLKVRVTGQPQVDLPLLRRLADRLAQPLDPQRIRVGSLADDVSADSMLEAGARGRGAAERQWAQAMRRLQPHQAQLPDHLASLMRPLKGDLLMLMAHIDPQHQAVVFRGVDGRPRQVPVQVLERAAESAGVQLLLVGCRSGRMARAGFADNLNSLDAARAMLRAQAVQPDNAFALLDALSGPDMRFLLDPQAFLTLEQLKLHQATAQGEPGPLVSTVHWLGAGTGAAVAAQGGSASQPAPAPRADKRPSPAERAQAMPALVVMGGLAGLSWLVSLLGAWHRSRHGGDRPALLWTTGLHLSLPPLWLAAWADAVGGADARWWAAGGAGLGLVGWLWQTQRLRHLAGGTARWWAWAVPWLRWAAATVPFVVALLAHEGWAQPGGLTQQGLGSLYALGRWLPTPLETGGILMIAAVTLYLAAVLVAMLLWLLWALVSAPWRALQAWRARSARHALWRTQLAEAGVNQPHAVLRTRHLLQAELPAGTRWDRMEKVTHFSAPDPWAGRPDQGWLLWTLPLKADQAAWGLMRRGSAFLHPLPQALVQRWQAQQVQTDELPGLLAQVQSRLKRGDFLTPARPRRLPLLWPLVGLGLAALAAGSASLVPPDEQQGLLALAALLLVLLCLLPWLAWARERWHLAWLLRQRARAPVAAAAA